MQLIDQSGPLGDHVVPALVEQRQDRGQILGIDGVGLTPQRDDAGRSGGVDDIVFASATPGQFRTRAVAVEDTSSTISLPASSH